MTTDEQLQTESPEPFVRAEAGFIWERRAPRPEDDHLLAHTKSWLSALPKGVRPIRLPEMFPRIANDLSRLWPESAALDEYFEEKEFSPRTDRQGFPPMIKEELRCIHVYSRHHRLTPREQRPPKVASLLR